MAVDHGRRLKLALREARRVEFLVHTHLVMSHLAFRRDISDEQVVIDFAVEVGSPDRLKMLYVLTASDLNAVGPGVHERPERPYGGGDVDFNEPAPADSAYSHFCGGCHTNFHGTPGDANIGGVAVGPSFEEMIRPPVAGVDIGAIGGGPSSRLPGWPGGSPADRCMRGRGLGLSVTAAGGPESTGDRD